VIRRCLATISEVMPHPRSTENIDVRSFVRSFIVSKVYQDWVCTRSILMDVCTDTSLALVRLHPLHVVHPESGSCLLAWVRE
jgi:hypothetical protein